VRFPFLDYSTLEKRHAACQSELDVNRRFARALYRRIVSITHEQDGSLKLDGRGKPVEWAVEMARFDENQTLDHLADQGHLDADLCRKLARNVAAMHEGAEPADGTAWIAALEQYVEQNTWDFTEHSPLFDTQAVKELDDRSRAAFNRLRPLLERRAELNLVRRGHGDLHLGNLALVDNEPMAFDAIEFDPVIASGDVLYDLAFLLMDLVERDLASLSNVVLNEYFNAVRRDADLDGIAALPFFMSLRAAIRAKVTAARLERSEAKDRPGVEASAQRYFRLACKLLLPMQPAVICTAGLSGTGKSVLARSLAPFMLPLPGALILRSDIERKAMTRLPETERLPPEAYSIDASAKLYALLHEKAGRIARAGHSVIVDAVFAREGERAAVETAARKAGAHFLGLFLTAPLNVRLQRVGGRHGDASDADAAVARQQEAYELGAMNWTLLDASGSPAETLAKALELLPDVIKAPARPRPAERRNGDPQAPGWHLPAHRPSSP
jgi:aminoglycoside phosphotransferase family enzyme/predicted kinase